MTEAMSLLLDDNGIATAAVDNTRYVLIGITDGGEKIISRNLMTRIEKYSDTKQMIRVMGENIFATPISYRNHTYWYVDLTEITKQQMNMSGYIGGILTGNLRCNLKLGATSYYEDMEQLGKAKIIEHSNFKYRYKLEKIREKISQSHHYHVRLIDLYKRAESVEVEGSEGVLCCYLDRFNQIEATHATFITYWRSVDERVRNVFYGMMISVGAINNEWLKNEGRCAKQSSVLTDIKLSQLYEINVLVNRLDTEVDWASERENRVLPNLAKVESHDVYRHAITLFSMAKQAGKKPMLMTFEEYWRQRAVAMPAGAIHDEDPEYRKIIAQLPSEVKNKKGFASALPYLEHTTFLLREKRINSYTSTKYEWGKTRALYGCDFTSHVHADFGMLACEETFPFFVPTGDSANNKYIAEVMRPYKHFTPVCYDYEDFNSQHSFDNMKAVIRAWLKVYHDKLSSDQIASVKWTIDSIDTQIVNNSMTNERYMTKGTLFSGWRLTSFINTALNYCYLAQSNINRHTSLHMHNGDDVFATTNNLREAIDLYVDAKALGIRANMTKMSIGTIAEFLRTDMRSRLSDGLQYLARGISTLVHSRIESAAPTTYRNLVEAYTTRYQEARARGAKDKILNSLYRKQLFFARKMFNVDYALQDKLLSYDPVCGGLKPKGIITNEEIYEVEISSKTLTEHEVLTLVSNGVSDYTTYLAKKFPLFTKDITKKKVLNSILSGYNVRRKTIDVRPANYDVMRRKVAMKGAWKNMKGIALINRIRMGISNIMVVLNAISDGHAKALSSVDDPIAWLALLLKN